MIRDVAVREAGEKGLGVFALRDFTRGEFIFRRRHGAVVANDDIPHLSEEDRRHLCELDRNTSAVLLPPGCYLNHSCEPNAMRSGVKVFAWQVIQRGSHIKLRATRNGQTLTVIVKPPASAIPVGTFKSILQVHLAPGRADTQ